MNQNLADLEENIKIYLAVKTIIQKFSDLLEQTGLNENEKRYLNQKYSEKDPWMQAVWETYQAMNNVKDAEETLRILLKIAEL